MSKADKRIWTGGLALLRDQWIRTPVAKSFHCTQSFLFHKFVWQNYTLQIKIYISLFHSNVRFVLSAKLKKPVVSGCCWDISLVSAESKMFYWVRIFSKADWRDMTPSQFSALQALVPTKAQPANARAHSKGKQTSFKFWKSTGTLEGVRKYLY